MMRGLPSLMPSIRRVAALLRAREGNAVVEFGLVAPVLGAVLVPVVDLGIGVYQRMQVHDAAQAGAQYAMTHGCNSTASRNTGTCATARASAAATAGPALIWR